MGNFLFNIDSNDCKHFELKCPNFSLAAEIKAELEETSGVFGIFEEFNRGLQDMSQQEWITFRCSSLFHEPSLQLNLDLIKHFIYIFMHM